jgi:hypothetical protein
VTPGNTPRRTIRAKDDLYDAIAACAVADDTDVSALTRMLWEAYRDLSPSAKVALRARAAREGTTLTAVIVAALEDYAKGA